MNYTPDAFLNLHGAIDRDGGALLPGTCQPKKIDYGKQQPPGFTASCRREGRFQVPYEGEGGKDGLVVACAFDDNIGMWPRYADA